MKIYLRLKDYNWGGAGLDVVFVTTDREKAFFTGPAQYGSYVGEVLGELNSDDHIHIWEDEKCVEQWQWSGIGGWVLVEERFWKT